MISKPQSARRLGNKRASTYADLDFWLALLQNDGWLSDRAERLLEEQEGELEVSLARFIELFLVEEQSAFDRERAVTAILELAPYAGDPGNPDGRLSHRKI